MLKFLPEIITSEVCSKAAAARHCLFNLLQPYAILPPAS